MSWIDALYRTYEANQSHISPAATTLLVPVAHIVQKAHLEVIINVNGQFIAAHSVSADDQSTVIPCTEKSAGRTSSPQAHPLSDQLQYVGADLEAYGVSQGDKHRLYRELLDAWCVSQFAHPVVHAVQRFVAGGTIVDNLIQQGLLTVDDERRLVAHTANADGAALGKLLGTSGPERALVRWRVRESGGSAEDRLWKNQEVWQSWIDFYLSTKEGTDLCYVTGEVVPTATQHPKYIRFPGDSAKIISANDTGGFTFRGVFDRADQLCSVGYDASQRVHSALQWLISRQGRSFDDLVYVAWAVSGKEVPDMLADPLDTFFAQTDDLASSGGSPPADSHFTDAGQTFAARFNNYISGYSATIDDAERIVVLGVDSVSPGRLSVVYYRELAGSEFIERVSQWHTSGAWPQDFGYDSRSGRRKVFVGVPAPVEIAKAAYGERADGSLKKRVVRDVVSSILDGTRIRRQLVESAYHRVCNRAAKSDAEWNKLLGITCSMVRLFLSRGKGGSIEMALDTERDTRDYLFGRLLAAGEQIERVALEQEGDGVRRPTSAVKLFHRFADRPSSTWRSIDTRLAPYRVRLTGNPLVYRYERTIDEVMSLFDPEDFTSDRPLSAEFLLGYHCQRYEYFRPKQSQSDVQEDEDADS